MRKNQIKNFVSNHEWIVAVLAIVLVAVIAYLPSIKNAGFYNDDYHILYGAYTSGIEKLREIAQIDRPMHGITFTMYFPLFGVNIHAYQIFEICTNILTALLSYWLMRMVWPRQKSAALIIAVLMSVFPGYIDHMRSFNFSLFMLNLFLYILSLCLSTKAMLVKSKPVKGLLIVASILGYLWAVLLNEYYIGLEVLRLGIFYLFAARARGSQPRFWKTLGRALITYLPWLVAGVGFFIWRFFIFTNQRNATNLGSFTSEFTASPVYESVSLAKGLIFNFFNVTFIAWVKPVYDYLTNLRLKDFIFCAALALAGAALIYLLLRFKGQNQKDETGDQQDGSQMMVLGALTVFATLFPVVFTNRNATYEYYGRYALPGMLAGLIFLVALLSRFVNHRLKEIVLGLLVFSGIFTQLGVGKALGYDWQGSKDIWWQLSWRAPSLEPGTLLTGSSSDYAIPEGYNLWSPANLIYYPEETNPVINGETLNIDLIQSVMEDKDSVREFRSFLLEKETENLLVLSKPSHYSCLHLIDGAAPNYSTYDSTNILLIGAYSHLDQVVLDAEPASPPNEIFGAEPAHGWCYYYQKAELALQKGDYEEVIRLRDEATANDLRQGDPSELLPFILAYAQTTNEQGLAEVLPIYMDYPFHKVNYCANLLEQKYGISEAANQLLLERSCTSSQ